MPAVSSPAAAGTAPQAAVNHSRPASRPTRPGRSPGARPMSSAPKTLPRRNAGRKVALGSACARTRGRLGHRLARLGVRRAAQDDHDALALGAASSASARRAAASASSLTDDPSGCAPSAVTALVVAAERARPPGASPGGRPGGGGQCGQCGRRRRQFDQGRGADHRLAQAQEETGQFLAAGRRPAVTRTGAAQRGVDRGPGQAEHQIGREAVAQLGVDRVGAEDALGQLGPGVGGLVGEPGPADHGDAAGPPASWPPAARGRGGQGFAPTDGDELAVLADPGLDQAAVFEATRLARLAEELAARRAQADHLAAVAGATSTASSARAASAGALSISSPLTDSKANRPLSQSQPWFTGSESMPEQPGQAVGGGLHGHPAPDGAGGAGRLHLVQVPGPGREAVGRRGERADRADLHRVAAEVGGERLGREGGDLDALAPAGEVDLGLPATSDANRVQRAHWMQRSRSSSTRSEMAIGFSKWRFSSMNRLSPGPWASVWSCSGHSPPLSQTGQSSG